MRLLLIPALLPLVACHASWEKGGPAGQASGTGATRSYAVSGFTGVQLLGSDDADVKVGNGFSVVAEGDPKVLDRLDIRVVDGSLRIGRKTGMDWSWGTDHGARIHVTMPRLTSASVSGSGDLDVQRGEGEFAGAVSGSGNLRIAQLAAESADLSIAGSGSLKAAGTATKLSASTTGSGDIDAVGLSANSASVSVAGSGNIRGTVKGEATVSIVGSGDVDLKGGAHCTVNSTGSGDAHCG